MKTNGGRYITIRQAAKKGPIPEGRLRQMEKCGELPGVRSGNRFLVNYDMLLEQLEAECRKNCKAVSI